MELEQAKNRLEELRPANPALEGASVIDVSLGAVMSRYRVEGPVCHVGSKLQHAPEGAGRGASFRRLFSGLRDNGFTGLDIEPGENVDVLADICGSNFEETHPELCQRFGFALVLALLEHVPETERPDALLVLRYLPVPPRANGALLKARATTAAISPER